MKWMPLLLAATALFLFGCASADSGGGRIGPDYTEPVHDAARSQRAHTNIQRGQF